MNDRDRLAALRRALFSAYAHGLIRFVRDADEATVAAFIDNMVRADGGWLDEERLARALDGPVDRAFGWRLSGSAIAGPNELAAAIAKAYREDTDAHD